MEALAAANTFGWLLVCLTVLPQFSKHLHFMLQAAISQADIDAWVSGQQPPSLGRVAASSSAALTNVGEGLDLQPIKLFSLNDYLGLSTHPAVRQAAADAALQCGNGARGGLVDHATISAPTLRAHFCSHD